MTCTCTNDFIDNLRFPPNPPFDKESIISVEGYIKVYGIDGYCLGGVKGKTVKYLEIIIHQKLFFPL